jgi:hypothetical protein
VEVNDPMPLESAGSDVFWPPHFSQDIESIMSEMTTTSEALVVVELKHPKQQIWKEPKVVSPPRDVMGCSVGLEPKLADGKQDFEFDNSFVNQVRVHDRTQELENYPGTFTATLWQPSKDGLESASSCAQDSVAATSFSKDVVFPEEDGAFSSGVSFDVQLLRFGDSHTIDEESRSGIDKYNAFELIADANEDTTGIEHIDSWIGESDRYAVDEIIARSVVIMSDPTLRHRNDTISSEVCEEIDVIYSDDTSQNGMDWIPADASDDSEYTEQCESFTSGSGSAFDDSDDSEASDSDASDSEIQEQIELFEESDYSDVSSRSKYSTCTDDYSESSDDTSMGEAIKREIREAKRLFGFLS